MADDKASKLLDRERKLSNLIIDRASGAGEKTAAVNALVSAQEELEKLGAPRQEPEVKIIERVRYIDRVVERPVERVVERTVYRNVPVFQPAEQPRFLQQAQQVHAAVAGECPLCWSWWQQGDPVQLVDGSDVDGSAGPVWVHARCPARWF